MKARSTSGTSTSCGRSARARSARCVPALSTTTPASRCERFSAAQARHARPGTPTSADPLFPSSHVQVRVVQHKKTKALYALKYINKARISKQRAVNNVRRPPSRSASSPHLGALADAPRPRPQIIQERRLLEEIDSPFVCNLRFAFQDDENLFMVLDLMLGGDLRFHLDRLGCMKEEVVRFYVAEMALALGDLHKLGIVHRCVRRSASFGRSVPLEPSS